MIDPHVHLRDWNQAHKETLAHGLAIAWRAGIAGVFEMPNTDPPLTAETVVRKRITAADIARRAVAERFGEAPFHGLYIGLTADSDQVRAAAALHGSLFPRVVGLKLYASHSTGGMGVIRSSEQLAVWRSLADAGYSGVVAVHAERQELLRPECWDPGRPESHERSRPALAEVASVQTQVSFAEAAGFRGTLHICHVSTPESAELIAAERGALPFRLTAATTPHHVLLSSECAALAARAFREAVRNGASTADSAAPTAGQRQDTAEGAPERRYPPAEFNVNPPLREPRTRGRLMTMLVSGAFDWIESDHAPHTWEEKAAGACGLPGLPGFRLLVEVLRRERDRRTYSPDTTGQETPREDFVSQISHHAVLDAFGIDPQCIPHNPNRDVPFEYAPLASEYPWDPYRFVTQ